MTYSDSNHYLGARNSAATYGGPDIVQLEPGRPSALYARHSGGNGAIGAESFGQRCRMRWSISQDTVAFGLLTGPGEASFCGAKAGTDTVAIYAGDDLEMVNGGAIDSVFAHWDRNLFQGSVDGLQLGWLSGSGWEQCALFHVDPRGMVQIRLLFSRAFDNSHSVWQPGPLIERALTILDGSIVGRDSARVQNSWKVARRAAEFLGADTEPLRPMSEICQELGVGWRNLNYAFRQHYNVTPSTFRQYVRLQRSRIQLLTSDNTSITMVAAANGFYHMGDFARYYRRLFGELPTETRLQSARIG